MLTETDSSGRVVTSSTFDPQNRPTQLQDTAGNNTAIGYSSDGMTSSTDALGQTTQYSYDLLNHLIKTTYADHSSSQTSYDALGHKISVSNELGQTTQYSYDAMSHLIRVTDPLGNTTRYGYDQAGHKTSQTDALGRTTLWGYDPYGRVTSRTLPLGQSETYSYDAAGRLASHSDFNGQTTSYLYDSNDQLIKRTYADGSVDNLSLDNQGRLIASLHIIGNQGATTYYQYDNADHLIKETKPTNDTLSYQYDPQGNKTQLSVTASNRSNNGNQTYNYSYDALNRLISTSDNQGTTQEGYNPVGNKVIEILPNGITANYAYDLRNRLISIVYSTSSGIISRTGYVLDAMGKRLAMAEISTGLGRHSAWQYDGLNRLTQEQITDDATGATLHATKYTLDLVGNRTNQTKDSNSTDYVYDNNDRLISASNNGSISASYSYDNQGNTISTTKNGLTTNYSYNALNQLTQSGSTQYSYDIDGIRSSKTTAGISTTYITDHNRDYAQVVEESNGSSSTNYTYGDTLISSTGTSGSNTGTSYFLKDAQGSTKALANSNGTITDTYSYSAYGETSSKTGTTANNYLYAGEQYDQDLGQYYNRARYYNPSIGRFSQQDTFEGHNQSPISLHKYLYGNGSPLRYTDPTGHDGLMDISAGLDIQGILATSTVLGVGLYSETLEGHVINQATGERTWGLWDAVEASYFRATTALLDNTSTSEDEATETKKKTYNDAHHTIPIYLCGAHVQEYVTLERSACHAPIHAAIAAMEVSFDAANAVANIQVPLKRRRTAAVMNIAQTKEGRAIIAGALKVVYTPYWEAGAPTIGSVFPDESVDYINGKTSLPDCTRKIKK